MQGLVIYNGSSTTKKVEVCARRILEEAQKQNIKMKIVKNDEIFNLIDKNNNVNIMYQNEILKPDFVVGWDKDTNLIGNIEKSGIRAFNSSESIKNCDDKSIMHSKLIGSNIKIPKTIIAPLVFRQYNLSKDYYENVVSVLGNNFIIKENKGSFGMQVYKIDSFETFLDVTKNVYSGFLMQENILSSTGRDVRVSIVGDKVVGAMIRNNDNDFRANITLGGTATMYDAPKEILDLALKAHNALGLDFSGVDILFGDNDEPILCEVNSNPNFLSFEKVSNLNFAKLIVEHIRGSL